MSQAHRISKIGNQNAKKLAYKVTVKITKKQFTKIGGIQALNRLVQKSFNEALKDG